MCRCAHAWHIVVPLGVVAVVGPHTRPVLALGHPGPQR